MGETCLEYLASHYKILQSNDQDVLNYVLKDSKRILPLTYNYQIQFLSKYFQSEVFSDSFKREIGAEANPLIIHYAAPIKPWMIEYYRMPYAKLWHTYKRKSQWRFLKDELPRGNEIKSLIKRYFLWPLNIRRPFDI